MRQKLSTNIFLSLFIRLGSNLLPPIESSPVAPPRPNASRRARLGVKSIFSDSNMEIQIQIYGNLFPADKPDKPWIRGDILMPANRGDGGTKSFGN